MRATVAVIAGDGIGPDTTAAAQLVLQAVARRYGHAFAFRPVLAGGAALDACGQPLPDATRDVCRQADAVLLGAVGGPKWDKLPGHLRPERALLGLRESLQLYANLRPVKLLPALVDASPLKREVLGDPLPDLLIVRELTGGLYFGERGRRDNGAVAFDTEQYSVSEILRVARVAFAAARRRRGHVTLVDKANVLESSRLWREVVGELAVEYADVTLDTLYVDNAAMQLVCRPNSFDVIVTSNLFGDILSDEASQISGSIGLLPSASLGDGRLGLYEPIHGSAPDLVGTGKANPLAAILSAALLLRHSLGLEAEARAVEAAVDAALAVCRTADIADASLPIVGTDDMTRAVLEGIG